MWQHRWQTDLQEIINILMVSQIELEVLIGKEKKQHRENQGSL